MAAKKKTDGKKNSDTRKKSSASSSAGKKSAKQPPVSKRNPKVKTEYERAVPNRALIAIICFVLFVLFVVIAVNPDGSLLKAIQQVVLGLVGLAGFYFAIPALAYIFIIQFSKKPSITSRMIYIGFFVFCCGSIYHLVVQDQGMASGFALIADLYNCGVEGTSGGVLCGGVAMLLRWSCGNTIAYIILGLSTLLSLLGALEFTVPGLIRAMKNRPKDDWEDEEQQEYVEPTTAVVNHFANKRIEQKRQQRQIREQPVPETAPITPAVPRNRKPVPSQPLIQQQPYIESVAVSSGTPSKASAMMNTIGLDINAPISAAKVRTSVPPIVPVTVQAVPNEFEGQSAASEKKVEPEIPSFVKQKDPVSMEKPIAAQEKTIVEKTVTAELKASTDKSAKITAKDTEESARQVAAEIAQTQAAEQSAYCFPPISLLNRPLGSGADGTDEMRENSRRLNETLASFRIDAHIINVTRGPSVTRYEVELDKGVRLSKLTSCADDIALSLGASGVRIAAVPGKISIVGIEVPNRAVTMVSLREVIDSPEFAKAKSKSSFSVGKDISGACIVGNIAKMPHMLIAGTTGSGKSVCMNSIIISLLYKASPEDVKLIMVDPKMVELGIYNGIPHLLIPVVTDPKKAAGSLQWAVTEMLRRYKMMSDVGVRDLESYNKIVSAEENGKKLPQVITIIDELADLMLVAAKEVEDSICRIAQMGRAAGMHLIIATQRPSADVITGLMKANIPSRIAFSVASAMESRIILDTQGAEKLVGKGDMLYAPIGCGKPLRVQGCFVTDSEVEKVAEYVKANYVPDYNQQVLEEIEKKALQTGKAKASASEAEPNAEELDGDEMLPAAVDIILETGQASVSMLQRRLKLGYARAARIVDEMEEKGIVGPFQGSKPRSILITKEQWAAKNGGAEQMIIDDIDSEESNQL